MDTTITNEQFFKLPKWAQLEIQRLRNNNEHLQKKADAIYGDAETNTFVREGMDKKPLPNNSRLEFRIGQNSLQVCVEGDKINIHAASFGGRMFIQPEVTNSVSIGFIER